MDPNATLSQLLSLAKDSPDEEWSELVLALDEWLRRGGFLPKRWDRLAS